jgi:hypothetical protein
VGVSSKGALVAIAVEVLSSEGMPVSVYCGWGVLLVQAVRKKIKQHNLNLRYIFIQLFLSSIHGSWRNKSVSTDFHVLRRGFIPRRIVDA